MRRSKIASKALPFAVILATSPSLAQEGTKWTGIYLGGHYGMNSGWGWSGKHDGSLANPYTETNTRPLNFNGPFGAQIGALWQHQKIVLGFELEHSRLKVGGTMNTVSGQSQFIENQNTAKLRLGVAAGDMLPYLMIGMSKATIGVRDIDRSTPNDANGNSISAPLTSYKRSDSHLTVGAGLEYALSPSFSVRGEYAYSNLGAPLFGTTNLHPGYIDLFTSKAGLSTARLAINYRFGLPTSGEK
jgi:opacity protein-like surface antigen